MAGCVSITACCNHIKPWAAVCVGFIASMTYSLAVRLMDYLKIDDPIEAFQVHGCCGFIGCLMVAIFETDKGLIYGGPLAGEVLGT